MKSGQKRQEVSEKKIFKDLYDFIHEQSPGAKADTNSG